MSEGFSLGERLRLAIPANENWTPQLHALAERLAPLSPEQRAMEWKDTMSEFIRRQETAGVPAETIGRRVTSMAKIVGDLIVTIERNAEDATGETR